MPRPRLRYLIQAAGAAVYVAAAAPGAQAASACLPAIEQAASQAGTPLKVLLAMAAVESSGHPWAVNDHGESRFFPSRAAAEKYLAGELAKGRRNLDIGCLQLNWYWHGEQIGTLSAALDPYSNALYGARYLRSLYDDLGSWSAAVGAYHSRQVHRADGYRCRVASALRPGRPIAGC